jgi:hypothetical protein
MGYFSHVATLGVLSHPWGIADMEIGWFQNSPYLFTGASADGGILRLRLAFDQVAAQVQALPATNATGSRNLSDLDILQINGQNWLLASGTTENARGLRPLAAGDGAVGAVSGISSTGDLTQWAQTSTYMLGNQPYLVAARWDVPGLQVFRVDGPTGMTRIQTLQDGPKTTLADVSALITVTPGTAPMIVAASGIEGGLTTYVAGANGQLALADTLGAAFGLGMGGITSLASAQVLGETFVLVGGATTGTLSSFRINPLGVMFEADHRLDDLKTRFGGVQDVATFSHQGRSFAVAGGADDGLTLFEIGPGGQLYDMQSIADQAGWTLGNVQSLAATVIGNQAQVFAAGSSAAGLTQFNIDMTRFGTLAVGATTGGTLTGTARDDHLEARGPAATALQGGAGHDRLVAGPGETTMFGGAGDDLFVFRPGGGTDRIMDFGRGADRIDLGAYPTLYTTAGLTITPTATGATLSVQGDQIFVQSWNGTSLSFTDFSADLLTFG